MSNEEIDVSGEEEDGKGSSPGINSLISYNRKLRDQLVEARAAHQAEVRELRDRIRALEESCESADQRVEEVKRSVAQEKERLEREKADFVATYQREQEALKGESQAQMDTIKVLQQEIDNLTGSLARAESRGGSLEKLKVTLLEKARALKAELVEVKSDNDVLNSELESLVTERDRLADKLDALAGPIAQLEEFQKQNEQLQASLKEQEEEFLKARAYREQAEAREAENARLSALAEEKVKLAEAAVKAQEEAEKQAFESRRKLLDTYAQEEAKEILKGNLESTQEELRQTQEELEAARAEIAAWQTKYDELENKLLYSSERDILKRSLANLAQRKSMGGGS